MRECTCTLRLRSCLCEGMARVAELESKLSAALKDAEKFEIALNDEISWRRAEESKVTELTSRLNTAADLAVLLTKERKDLESRLDSLSSAVRKAWDAHREGDMWQSLSRAMDIVDPERNAQPIRAGESCSQCGEELPGHTLQCALAGVVERGSTIVYDTAPETIKAAQKLADDHGLGYEPYDLLDAQK